MGAAGSAALFLAAITLAAAGPTRLAGQDGRPRALVIGITGYPEFEPEYRLKYAANDARAFAEFIRTPRGGGFDPADVKLLVDSLATRTAILDAIHDLRDVGSDDVVYVFFAGHGIGDRRTNEVYYMPYDADDDRPADKGFRADRFIRLVRDRISPRHLIFFIDACFAGASYGDGRMRGPGDNAAAATLQAWEERRQEHDQVDMAFFSARNSQRSWEDDELGHGVFTYYLLRGLAGDADVNSDGDVTAKELNRYLLIQVEDHVHAMNGRDQTPDVSPGFVESLPLSLRGRPITAPAVAAHQAYTRARARADAGDELGAIRGYEEALRLDSTYSAAYNSLGVLTEADDSALVLFRKATRHNPGFATAHYNQGVMLRNLGRDEEAIAAYQQSIRYDADYASPHNNLGVIYEERGEIDRAIEEYREAIRLDPEHPYAHANLGGVLAEVGNFRDAISALELGIRYRTGGRAGLNTELQAARDSLAAINRAVAAARDSARVHPDRWHDLLFALHERAYDFEGAYGILDAQVRGGNPDPATAVELAEASLTSGRFRKADSLFTILLDRRDLGPRLPIVARALHIALLEATGRQPEVPVRLAQLRQVIQSRPDTFNLNWLFGGAKYFIRHDDRVSGQRVWLIQLLDALERGVRAEILAHLPSTLPVREVTWGTCGDGAWCDFGRLDLDHDHFDGRTGVYVVWRTDDPGRRVVRVGGGRLRPALRALREDVDLRAETDRGRLSVTWATLPPQDHAGVEKYLTAAFSPVYRRSILVRSPIVVNLPW